MTLIELSVEYRAQAVALRKRIDELEHLWPFIPDDKRPAHEERIKILSAMWRETRDLSILTRRYYERGYHRNERYSL